MNAQMRVTAQLIAVAAVSALLVGPAWGQQPGNVELSFELRDAPLNHVLSALSELVPGFRFGVKPEVKGNVTALMERTSLTEALRRIVEEVNASYKVDQGTYVIEKQSTTGRRGSGGPTMVPRPGTGGTTRPGTTAPPRTLQWPTPPRRTTE